MSEQNETGGRANEERVRGTRTRANRCWGERRHQYANSRHRKDKLGTAAETKGKIHKRGPGVAPHGRSGGGQHAKDKAGDGGEGDAGPFRSFAEGRQ
jgi:hypothetical protein